MEPPSFDAAVDAPALRERSPPIPLFPEPTVSMIAPPLPDVAAPEPT